MTSSSPTTLAAHTRLHDPWLLLYRNPGYELYFHATRQDVQSLATSPF